MGFINFLKEDGEDEKSNLETKAKSNEDAESLQNWNELIEESDNLIENIEFNFDKAEPQIKEVYKETKDMYHDAVKTKDYKLLSRVIDRLKFIDSSIHEVEIIMFTFLELAASGEFANQSLADEWIRKGESALSNGNIAELRLIVSKLYKIKNDPNFVIDETIEDTDSFHSNHEGSREIFEFLMEDGEDDVISVDVNPDDFDSLFESLKKKYDEFVEQNYSKLSDVPKIEEFLKSIRYEYYLLRRNFGDCFDFQLLSDRIANSVKQNYVFIVNKMDSFDGSDFDVIIMVFKELIYMSYFVATKEDIGNTLEQLERIKESRG